MQGRSKRQILDRTRRENLIYCRGLSDVRIVYRSNRLKAISQKFRAPVKKSKEMFGTNSRLQKSNSSVTEAFSTTISCVNRALHRIATIRFSPDDSLPKLIDDTRDLDGHFRIDFRSFAGVCSSKSSAQSLNELGGRGQKPRLNGQTSIQVLESLRKRFANGGFKAIYRVWDDKLFWGGDCVGTGKTTSRDCWAHLNPLPRLARFCSKVRTIARNRIARLAKPSHGAKSGLRGGQRKK